MSLDIAKCSLWDRLPWLRQLLYIQVPHVMSLEPEEFPLAFSLDVGRLVMNFASICLEAKFILSF